MVTPPNFFHKLEFLCTSFREPIQNKLSRKLLRISIRNFFIEINYNFFSKSFHVGPTNMKKEQYGSWRQHDMIGPYHIEQLQIFSYLMFENKVYSIIDY